ncbi:YraN family protein [Glutamicibacter sp. NPDC087344]|uniref:YraN family protein n=1 Tax=Glutamicibacter sp. NPDC087344 TaxID=3363994 RepID=UPI003810BB4E
MRTTQQQLGDRGEAAAAEFLIAAGYWILERNWRCRFGELDLVARDPAGALAAVEVKTRSSMRFGTGFDAVHPAKFARLQRLLIAWCQAHGSYCPAPRVDVIEVYPAPDGSLSCRHLKDVRS